jgi:uncharacterized membrane protein YphA (DoxX/SURF4 family)
MTAIGFIAVLLALAFTWAAALNLTGPDFIRSEFDAWGYPKWLRPLVGLLELAAAAALLFPASRVFGATLGAAILVGVVTTLARDRAWMRLEYPLVLLALCAYVGLQAFA